MIPNTKKIYLCQPDLTKICVINGLNTQSVDFHPQIKGYSELSFEVDRYISINGQFVESNCYEELKPYMYVYLEDIGYFIIDPPQTSFDGNKEIKSITAYSAEKEFESRDWVGIKINCGTSDSMEYSNTDESNKDDTLAHFAINYVTMVNENNHQLSFLHQILDSMSSKWSIGRISPKLINAKLPALDISAENLYAVMNSDVAPRMSCIFIYDYNKFTINAFHKDELGFESDIFIGFRNLANQVSISVDSDSIYTRFTVQGDQELEFRDVNYGDNTIINLDYFLGFPYMKQAMVDKYRQWQALREEYIDEYINYALQYNQLMEKRDELIYRVPSDGSKWDSWDNMSEEGLQENLKYYLNFLQSLEEVCDTREYDEKYNHQDKLNAFQGLAKAYNCGVFGNINLNNRQKLYWGNLHMHRFSTALDSFGIVQEENEEEYSTTLIQEYTISSHEKTFVVAYSPIIQTNNGPYMIAKNQMEEYISYLIDTSYNNTGIIDFDHILQYDTQGLKMYSFFVHDMIAWFSELKENDVLATNASHIAYETIQYYESDENKNYDAYIKIKSVLGDFQDKRVPLEALGQYEKTKEFNDYITNFVNSTEFEEISYGYMPKINDQGEVDYDWYKNILYSQMDVYSGYYTFCEIVDYIIPNIKLAISNLNKIDSEKEKPTAEINENWELYGLEELQGVEKTYSDGLESVKKYSKSWDELTDEDKKDQGLNYIDDGTGENYNNSIPRQEYIHYSTQLGDENTEGTIRWRIKQLQDEIAQVEEDMKQNFAITNDYNRIMRYDITAEEADKCTNIPEELIQKRKECIFTPKELLTFDYLLKDTDYVNSNIVATSILSVSQTFEVQKQLLEDAKDKLSEVSQPQYKFSVSLDNFFRIAEYESWAQEFDPKYISILPHEILSGPLGLLRFIRVGIRDDYAVKLRVIGYRWNPCEVTPDLSIDFSNMITSRTGRSDLTELLEQENNRGSKNSIKIGNGSADSEQEYIMALMDLLKNNSIFTKSVQNIASNTVGGTNTATVQAIVGDYLNAINIDATTINVGNITGTTGEFENLFTKYLKADTVVTKLLDADEAKIKDLTVEVLRFGRDSITQITKDAIQTEYISADNIDVTELFVDSFIQVGQEGLTKLTENSITTEYIVTKMIEGESANFDQLSVKILDFGKDSITKITEDAIKTAEISADQINVTDLFVDSVIQVGASGITQITEDTITTDYVIAKMISAKEGQIDELSSKIIKVGEDSITEITGEYLKTAKIDANNITVKDAFVEEVLRVGKTGITTIMNDTLTTETVVTKLLNASEVQAENVRAMLVTADSVIAGLVQAQEGDFNELTAENAFIKYLNANLVTAGEIDVNDLKAKMATIDVLDTNIFTADTAFIKSLQSRFSTFAKTVIDDSYIKNIVSNNIQVADLKAGDITVSDSMRILSENGAMVMNGTALQIYGKDNKGNDYVGIQLGYDTSKNPSLILRNESGATVLTPDGITSDAIANELIVNNMIKEGTIDADRLSFQVMEKDGKVQIEQIYNGDGKFGAEWTTFQQKVNEISTYDLFIETPYGTNLSTGSIILIAKLLENNVDVTDDYEPSCFIWTRHSQDSNGDINWNNNHSQGAKSIILTSNDLKKNAEFRCKFEYEDISVTSD